MTMPNPSVLREMGLGPVWRLRVRTQGAVASAEAGVLPALDDASADGEVVVGDDARSMAAAADARLAATATPSDATNLRPSAPIGGGRSRLPDPTPQDALARRDPVPEASPSSNVVPAFVDSAGPERAERIASLDWDALEADIRACTACRLCESRRQAVPGVGARDADWLLVGEGPGAEEDRLGEPFVGAAGKLLDAMMASIALKRGEGVYIANAVKCRPPHNRTPQPDEIATCRPYLERQIALIGPKLIVALGRPAAQSLLESDVRISAVRGQVHRYREIPVVVTYHPAYLLRNQADKAKAWEDLCFATQVIEAG